MPAIQKQFSNNFEQCRPYRAQFGEGIWHVRGTLPTNALGGTPEADVSDDTGEVIRVYHSQ